MQITTLCQIFSRLFYDKYKTRVQYGYPEPVYQPHLNGGDALICCREEYLSSVLHEVAHWCIAGEKRRSEPDYGYWYEPDGRTEQQQAKFEHVEVKPQAIEWLFSLAIGHPFHLSADNLDGTVGASKTFTDAVYKQASSYLRGGLPNRAQSFLNELLVVTGTSLCIEDLVKP